MNPAIAFLLFMVGIFGTVGGVMATVFNFDQILVFLLRSVNAPVYQEARRIAALIYQHPEQWAMTSHTMRHPRIGEIWFRTWLQQQLACRGQRLRPLGSKLHRAADHLQRGRLSYRRDYIKHLLTQVLNAPALNVPAAAGVESPRWLEPRPCQLALSPQTSGSATASVWSMGNTRAWLPTSATAGRCCCGKAGVGQKGARYAVKLRSGQWIKVLVGKQNVPISALPWR